MNPDTRRDRTSRLTGRRPRTILTVIVLVAVIAPLGYVFAQFWSATSEAAAFVEAERNGVGEVLPVTELLAALVDAQTVAARGATVDVSAVRAAVERVNRADPGAEDSQPRQRRAQLTIQIESTLAQKGTGPEAARAYAIPIGLTQALLGKIGDSAKIIRDPALDAYHLADTALLRLPEVIVNAGQLVAQARIADAKTNRNPPGAAIARDRVATAANTISVGLRSGTESVASASADMTLLKPLDEFGAAIGAIVRASSAPDLSTATARSEIEAAQRALQSAALVLSSAVLNSFDGLLAERADRLSGQRRNVLIAGVMALLAAIALFWLRLPALSASRDRESWDGIDSPKYPMELVPIGRGRDDSQ